MTTSKLGFTGPLLDQCSQGYNPASSRWDPKGPSHIRHGNFGTEYSELLILFAYEPKYLRSIPGAQEPVPEGPVLQQAGHSGQCLQVLAD